MRTFEEHQNILALYKDGYNQSEIARLTRIPRCTVRDIVKPTYVKKTDKPKKYSATYTNEQFVDAVKSSFSVREVLLKLGLTAAGGAYKCFYKRIKKFAIDISHFTGQKHWLSKPVPLKRPIEDYLSNKIEIQSFKLKGRLLREKIFLPICSSCSLETWLDKPIPLELDHIDGNSQDNSLSNLRLLCPNCHAMTETYRGKNIKKYSKN